MTLDKRKLLITFITVCIVIFVIIVNNLPKENQKIENKNETINNNNNNNKSDNNILKENDIKTKISISYKCIGCGKCARIDPEHFYSRGRSIPDIISNKNLDSNDLKIAISICPTSAINLN